MSEAQTLQDLACRPRRAHASTARQPGDYDPSAASHPCDERFTTHSL